jgi:exosortase H (IPTLxxWG-CTERM-specific)
LASRRKSAAKAVVEPPVARPGRFFALFAVFFLAGFALLMAPPVQPAVVSFSRALVAASGALIHLCRGHAQVAGTALLDPSTGAGIEMKDGCNGLYVTLLLCSALAAFPASWKQRAKGLAIGIGAIQSLNVVRFISLYYLCLYNQAWFDFAHEYLWESLIMLDALAVFWMWVQLVFRSTAVQDAPA